MSSRKQRRLASNPLTVSYEVQTYCNFRQSFIAYYGKAMPATQRPALSPTEGPCNEAGPSQVVQHPMKIQAHLIPNLTASCQQAWLC